MLALLFPIKAHWHSKAAWESGQQLQQVKCSVFVSAAGHLFQSAGTKGHKLLYRQMVVLHGLDPGETGLNTKVTVAQVIIDAI